MRSDKFNRAMAEYKGFKGTQTVQHVERIMTAAGLDEAKLTGQQWGQIMQAVNEAYHEGRASTGAEVFDGLVISGDCVAPLKAVRKISRQYNSDANETAIFYNDTEVDRIKGIA